MDAKRARDIANSPVMVDVSYNGTRIYIESVDVNNGSARIHPLSQPRNPQEVPVNNLIEQ